MTALKTESNCLRKIGLSFLLRKIYQLEASLWVCLMKCKSKDDFTSPYTCYQLDLLSKGEYQCPAGDTFLKPWMTCVGLMQFRL